MRWCMHCANSRHVPARHHSMGWDPPEDWCEVVEKGDQRDPEYDAVLRAWEADDGDRCPRFCEAPGEPD